MKFLKQFFFGKSEDDFYANFDARANGFCIENGVKRKLEDYVLILFKKNVQKEWSYNLVVGTGKVHSWTFPIDPNWKVICKPDDFKKTMDFEIQIKKSLTLVLEFPAHGNLEVIAEFRSVLNRLLYQTRNKKNSSECQDQSEIDGIIEYSEKDLQKVEISDQILATLTQIETDDACEFAVVGELLEFDSSSKSTTGKIKTIFQESVLAIFASKNFNFEMKIVDETNSLISSSSINKDFDYFIDYKSGLFLWRGHKQLSSHQQSGFAFKINSDNLRILENLFLQFFIESENGVSFDQFLKNDKGDWQQFYSKQKSSASETESSEMLAYKNDDDFLNFEFDQPSVDFSPILKSLENQNQFVVQFKLDDKILSSRGTTADVYEFDEAREKFEFKSQFDFSKNQKVIPSKMILNEHSNTLFMNDARLKDSVHFFDLGKQTIVSTFTPKNDKAIQDIDAFGGKNSFQNVNPLCLAIGSNEIYKLDPRDPNGIVETKNYSSKVGFSKLVAVRDSSFAIASNDGAIRLYKDLSSNAKNLIPSFLNDKIISLDATRDGSLLLANCGRYLMLYLTKEQENSGFSVTFRKDKKPTPRILKVHPMAISQLNLESLSFTCAKFDEHKIAHERFIIAWNEKAYAVWSITKIMRNEFSTDIVRRLNDKVVFADFKFETSGIITAFPNRLAYQKTKHN